MEWNGKPFTILNVQPNKGMDMNVISFPSITSNQMPPVFFFVFVVVISIPNLVVTFIALHYFWLFIRK